MTGSLRNHSSNCKDLVSFSVEEYTVSYRIETIRADNADLDLRPERFLDTIDFRYSGILDIFTRGHLNSALLDDIRELLNALDGNTNYKNSFTAARKLLEAVCHRINELDANLIPKEVFGEHSLNLKNTLDYLSGNQVWNGKTKFSLNAPAVFPRHVSSCVRLCKELGDSKSHFYTPSVDPNAFRASAYALIEFLEWFKQFCDEKTAS